LFHRKKNRLSSEKEIGKLFTDGNSNFNYPIKSLYVVNNFIEADYKILVSVSKRNIKKAVLRNLVKRRIKEALRLNIGTLKETIEKNQANISIAIIYVSGKIISYKEIELLVIRHLNVLCKSIDRIEKKTN